MSMKIKKDFVLRKVAGEYVVIPVGENVVDFTAMIALNETSAFIWKLLETETTTAEITKKVIDEYDVDEAKAEKDVEGFIIKLKEADILE